MKTKIRSLAVCIALIALGLAAVFHLEIVHSEFERPDGRYRVVVKKRFIMSFIPMMPGHGSDAPGSVTIYDMKTGENMGRREVEMLWQAQELQWTRDGAVIWPFLRWELD